MPFRHCSSIIHFWALYKIINEYLKIMVVWSLYGSDFLDNLEMQKRHEVIMEDQWRFFFSLNAQIIRNLHFLYSQIYVDINIILFTDPEYFLYITCVIYLLSLNSVCLLSKFEDNSHYQWCCRGGGLREDAVSFWKTHEAVDVALL